MDSAREIDELVSRYKAATAKSDPAALAPAAVAGQIRLVDDLVQHARALRARLQADIAADEAKLTELRAEEARMVGVVKGLEATQADHADTRKRAAAALATVQAAQAASTRDALAAARRAVGRFNTVNAGLIKGNLDAARGYTADAGAGPAALRLSTSLGSPARGSPARPGAAR